MPKTAVKLTINKDRTEVHINGREVMLRPMEFKILRALHTTRRTLSRNYILDMVYDGDRGFDNDLRVVDQHVSRLRQKLNEAAGKRVNVIQTVLKCGYKIAAV